MKPASIVLAAALLASSVGAAQAGMIERACLNSERSAANRVVCGCIQRAADVTLNRGEQRQAARFFQDPHQAQMLRQSNRRSDEVFWQRYKRFGATAEEYCRRT